MKMEEALFFIIGVASIAAFLVSSITVDRRTPQVVQVIYAEPPQRTGVSGCGTFVVLVVVIVLVLSAIFPS